MVVAKVWYELDNGRWSSFKLGLSRFSSNCRGGDRCHSACGSKITNFFIIELQ